MRIIFYLIFEENEGFVFALVSQTLISSVSIKSII